MKTSSTSCCGTMWTTFSFCEVIENDNQNSVPRSSKSYRLFIVTRAKAYSFHKFQQNSSIIFWISATLLTDRQTNQLNQPIKLRQKHNLLRRSYCNYPTDFNFTSAILILILISILRLIYSKLLCIKYLGAVGLNAI